MGRRLVPDRWARYYLENAPSLTLLLLANVAAVLVGVRYYVATMPVVPTFLWPLYADSPTAVFLMALSVATLLPFLGPGLDAVPRTRLLAYLHTLAFVWLVETGLWTVVALHLGFALYFPGVWDYFGILLTHLGFLAEAALVPHYAVTTRGALATALGMALLNDAVDYWLGLHPPLRYEPDLPLAAASVTLSVAAVALAAVALDRGPERAA
ncbi:MAG: DUF1405 domain-containing protein [Halorientalis sp.]